MSKTLYPAANATLQYFARKFTGSTMSPNVVVLHTTEGFDWPGYGGGATAPNLTIKPNIAKRTSSSRQHYPANKSSRALENRAGGVQTNTLNAFQIELIGTCDSRYAKRWGSKVANVDYIYWPDAPDWALAEVAKVLAWLNDQWPAFPLKDGARRGWKAYPASYGLSAAQRLTGAEWVNTYGVVGHQHVPENSHGDPGNVDVSQLLELARGAGPVVPPVVIPPVSGGKVQHLVAMTYNVVAEVAHVGQAKFKVRVPHIVDFIEDALPDVIHFQEFGDATTAKPLHDQLGDAGYTRLILGNWRAIYYRRATVDRKTAWRRGELKLAGATVDGVPDTKAVVFGLLRHKASGQPFWAISAHLSHRASEGAWRRKQGRALRSLAEDLQKVKAAPVVLGMDANSSNEVVAAFVAAGWVDGRSAKERISFAYNSHNALRNPPLMNEDHIDHIVALGAGGTRLVPTRWEQFGNVKNGQYELPFPSDHNPVVVDFEILEAA